MCLLSLGCGSTRAVINALSQFNNQPEIRSKFIDINRDALEYGQKLAKESNVSGQLEWYRNWIENLENYCDENFQPDIIEMMGLLDYFNRKRAIDIVRRIHKTLSLDGWLIVSNICPNLERPFITKGVGWSMIYRRPQELAEIMNEAGFSDYRLIYEPLKIHGLAIAQKNSV